MGVSPKSRGSMGWGLTALVCVATLATGCKVQTDLGAPCTLVRRDPADTDSSDGVNSIPILESEVTTGTADGLDYISFGATECEDLVCVRDKSFVSARDKGSPAEGYCSKPCEPSLVNQCPPANEADATDPVRQLNCRPLLLDEETLTALRERDPAKYKAYFGETTTPNFCARGNGADGSTDGGS